MLARKIAIGAIFCVCVLAIAGTARAQEIKINKWPDDVPCDALKKNPDGSWTLTKVIIVGNARIENVTTGSGRDVQIWDQKCGNNPPKQ